MHLLRPIAAAALICIPAAADHLTLDNGDRLTGKIVTVDKKTVVLKTAYAGEITLDRTMVTGIQSDEPLNVVVESAGTIKGKIDESATTTNIVKQDGTSMTVKPAEVTAIRDDAAQAAHEREVLRLTHPPLDDFWTGFIALALANASGNSSTTTISTAASATRAAGGNKMTLSFTQLYARQSTTVPHGETANKISGAFRIDHDLSPKLFVYGINAYDYDRFQYLDLRVVLGGGLGYHVWKSDNGYLDVSLGADWNREAFAAHDSTAAFTRNSAELTIGEEGGYAPTPHLKLFERLAFLPNLTDTGNYRIAFDTTASVPILKSLEWNFGFSDRYLSNPPVSVLKNDTILTMGIRFSFDQTKR